MASYFWEHGNTRLRPLRADDVDAYLSADLDSEAKRTLNLESSPSAKRQGFMDQRRRVA